MALSLSVSINFILQPYFAKDNSCWVSSHSLDSKYRWVTLCPNAPKSKLDRGTNVDR